MNNKNDNLRFNFDYYLGKFDAKDLVFYFKKLGIKLDLEEAKKLVEK